MTTSISTSVISVVFNPINMDRTDWMWSILHGIIQL